MTSHKTKRVFPAILFLFLSISIGSALYYASTFNVNVVSYSPTTGSHVYTSSVTFSVGAEVSAAAFMNPEIVNVYLRLDGTNYLMGTQHVETSQTTTLARTLTEGIHTYAFVFRNPDNPFDSATTSFYTLYVEPSSESITFSITAPSEGSTKYTTDSVLFSAGLTTNVPGAVSLVVDGSVENVWTIGQSSSQMLSYYIDGSDIGVGSHTAYFRFITARSTTDTATRNFDVETPPVGGGDVYYFGTETPANGSSVMEGDTAIFGISLTTNVGGELSFWIDGTKKTGWSLAGGTSYAKSYDTTTLTVGNHTYYWSWDLLNSTTMNTTTKVINIYEYVPLPEDAFSLATENFTRRLPVVVTTSEDTTDYQIQVNLTHDSDMNSTGQDIRFTDSDGSTILNYWMDRSQSVNGSYYYFFVRLPVLENKTIYAYYGNWELYTTSNGSLTFPSFSDFEGVKESFWTTTAGTWSVDNKQAYSYNYSYNATGTTPSMNTANLTATFPIIVEGSFRSSDVGAAGGSCGFAVTNTTHNVWWTQLRADHVQYYDTDYRDVSAAVDNTWYKLKLVLKPGASYDIYVDDVLEKADANYRVANATNMVTTYVQGFTSANNFVDRIFSRSYLATEPDISFGSEEANAGEINVTLISPVDDEVMTEGNISFRIGGSSPVAGNLSLWIGNSYVWSYPVPAGGMSFYLTRNVTWWVPGTYNITAKFVRLPEGAYVCGGYLEQPCLEENDTALNVVITPLAGFVPNAPTTYQYYDGEGVTFGGTLSNYQSNGSITLYLRAYTYDSDSDTYSLWSQIGSWTIAAGSVDQQITKVYSFPTGNYTFWWFLTGYPGGVYQMIPDDGYNLTILSPTMNLNPFTAFKSMVSDSVSGETGGSWIMAISNILFDPFTTIAAIGIGVGIATGSLAVGGIIMYAIAIVFSLLNWIAIPVILLVALGVSVAIWKMWGGVG